MPTFLTLGRPPSDDGRPLLDGLLVAGPVAAEPDAAVLDAAVLDAAVLDAAWAPAEASDALAAMVHSGRSFTATAADGAGVLRVLAGTVAALRGDDVRAAWRTPDAVWVAAVPDPAARALREVLVHVAVPDVERATRELH